MNVEHREYLDDIVGSQKDEWIHVAIASHLRRPFPELSEAEALAIVKEYCEGDQAMNKNDGHRDYYDYKHQAWVVDGKYQCCGHSFEMDCKCYGKEHEGEEAQ